jgi:hypothetical protein
MHISLLLWVGEWVGERLQLNVCLWERVYLRIQNIAYPRPMQNIAYPRPMQDIAYPHP